MAKIREICSFVYDVVKEVVIEVKNDFLTASCKPSFMQSMFGVIGILLTYTSWMMLSFCIAFLMFIAVCIVLCLIYEFPVTCGAVGLGMLLLMLTVKLIRLTHKDLVNQAKQEREREIDAIVAKWRK